MDGWMDGQMSVEMGGFTDSITAVYCEIMGYEMISDGVISTGR